MNCILFYYVYPCCILHFMNIYFYVTTFCILCTDSALKLLTKAGHSLHYIPDNRAQVLISLLLNHPCDRYKMCLTL